MQPLTHIHVIEFEGIGPGPLCGRVLADLGAALPATIVLDTRLEFTLEGTESLAIAPLAKRNVIRIASPGPVKPL